MTTAEQASDRLHEITGRDTAVPRKALLVLLYGAVYIALDRSSVFAQMWPGISAWYLPAGLSAALFLSIGFRMAPVAAVIALGAAALDYHTPVLGWSFLPQSLVIVLGYAAAAAVLRRIWPIDLGLRTLRDATRFVLVMLAASGAVASLGALTSVADGLVPRSQYAKAVFNWWVGDSIAIVSLTPLLLVYVAPWIRSWVGGSSREQVPADEDDRFGSQWSLLSVLEEGAQLGSIAAAIWLVFFFAPASRYEPLYSFFIPIIWISGRRGLRGAVVGTLLLNAGVMFAAHFSKAEIDSLARLQLVLLTVALTALFTGSVVSERHRALGALRESKENLRTESRLLESVLDSIGEGVVVADENGRYLHWNPAAEEILGLWRVGAWPDPGQRGLYFSDTVTPFPREDLPLARAVRGEASDSVQIFVRYGNRPGIWTSATGRPIRDKQGRVHGGVAVFRDISKRKQAEEEYRKAQERLNGIYSCSLDAMAYVGLDGTLLEVNEAFLTLTGYSREELLGGLTYQEITPPEYAAAEAACVDDLLRTGNAHEFEKEYVRKDGSRVPILITSFLVAGKDGKPAGMGAVIKDITERRRAETLRVGQNRILEMIATGTPLEVMLSALARLVESQCEGMLCSVGLLDGDYLRHGAAPSLPAVYTGAIDGTPIGPRAGSCGTAVFRGEPVIVTDILADPLWEDYAELAAQHGLRACWSTPIKSCEGRVVGTLAMYYREPRSPRARELQLIDIASRLAGIGIERKRVEEELRQSEERFSKAFRASPAAVSISTLREGRYVDANETCLKMFEYDRSELIGRCAAELVWVNPEDRGRFVQEMERENVVRSREVKLRAKSGRIIDAVLSAERVHLGGEPCALIITEDVTERKRADDVLRERTLELERSNSDLEQFAYVASHDLQEPLRMVASFTQLLAAQYKGRLDAQADEFIGFAAEGATRMQALINGLLDFSRVQTRAKDLQPTDCQAAFECSLANLKVALQESRARITCDPLPTVLADRSQMEQLFQNLMGNAVKFRGREDPRVHVGAQRNGREWILSVSDNGIGIDPRHEDRIFAIFQRLHTRAAYPGTGIGLAICKKIVERHGGRIWVKSAEGQGTTFYFTIPIAEALEA
jgi:PAS domain S-box-containing protein